MSVGVGRVRRTGACPWLGPFRFEIGFHGFRELFHAANDRYMRKLGGVGVLFTWWIIPGGIYYTVQDLLRHTFVFSWSELFGDCCGLVIALGFLWLLVRPPFAFVTRLDEVARFFVAHGASLGEDGVDPRRVVVSVSSSLCALGGEEVMADGSVVRTPFMVMRPRVVWTRGFLFLPVRDRKRDSVLWNMLAEGGGLFRKAWDGDGVALPRACVPDRRRVAREVRARVREASDRYRRAARLADRGGSGRAEALALLAPELEWLGEGEQLNEANRRLRASGGAPPVAERLVDLEEPERLVRGLRAVWRRLWPMLRVLLRWMWRVVWPVLRLLLRWVWALVSGVYRLFAGVGGDRENTHGPGSADPANGGAVGAPVRERIRQASGSPDQDARSGPPLPAGGRETDTSGRE